MTLFTVLRFLMLLSAVIAQCDHLPRFTKEPYNQTVCTPSGTNKTQDILTLSCAIEVLSKSSKTHYIRWIQALDVNDNNWIINNETYNITERRMSNQIQSSVSTIESILTLNISNARHSGFYYWCIVFNNKDKLYPVSQQVFITKQINSFSCIDKSDYKTKCLSYPPLSSSATRSVSSDDMSVDTIVAIVIPVILFVILVCLIIIFAILIVRKLKQTSRHDIKGRSDYSCTEDEICWISQPSPDAIKFTEQTSAVRFISSLPRPSADISTEEAFVNSIGEPSQYLVPCLTKMSQTRNQEEQRNKELPPTLRATKSTPKLPNSSSSRPLSAIISDDMPPPLMLEKHPLRQLSKHKSMHRSNPDLSERARSNLRLSKSPSPLSMEQQLSPTVKEKPTRSTHHSDSDFARLQKLEGEAEYSHLNYQTEANQHSQRSFTPSPTLDGYSQLNIIEDKATNTDHKTFNGYSYVDIDILNPNSQEDIELNDSSSLKDDPEGPQHYYFVLEIPEDDVENNGRCSGQSEEGELDDQIERKDFEQSDKSNSKPNPYSYVDIDLNSRMVSAFLAKKNTTNSPTRNDRKCSPQFDYEEPICTLTHHRRSPSRKTSNYCPVTLPAHRRLGVSIHGQSPRTPTKKSASSDYDVLQHVLYSPSQSSPSPPHDIPVFSDGEYDELRNETFSYPSHCSSPRHSPLPSQDDYDGLHHQAPRMKSSHSPASSTSSPLQSPLSPRSFSHRGYNAMRQVGLSRSPSSRHGSQTDDDRFPLNVMSRHNTLPSHPSRPKTYDKLHHNSSSDYHRSSSSLAKFSSDKCSTRLQRQNSPSVGTARNKEHPETPPISPGIRNHSASPSPHDSHVGIIITENGPLLLPRKRSQTGPSFHRTPANTPGIYENHLLSSDKDEGSKSPDETNDKPHPFPFGGHYEYDPRLFSWQ